MNIIEAIKSGKRFRHSSWHTPTGKDWYSPISDPDNSRATFKLDVNQLVSDDWEVEEKQVTITESDFELAMARADRLVAGDESPEYGRDVHVCEYLAVLKKELGL